VNGRINVRSILLGLAAPLAALLIAVGLSSIALVVSNINPSYTFARMIEYGTQPDSITDILNRSTYYYIAAIAVAIGFRMNLFNIGVDGQYQIAAMVAASVGGAAVMRDLPGPLLLATVVIVAVVVGACWAGIAGALKVTRGVSEVISTIMLNAIAGGIVAYLISEQAFGVLPEGGNILTTRELPESAWVPGIPLVPGSRHDVFGFIIVAVLVGVGYWLLISRTGFGFDLRAAGANASAAVASGVNVGRMVLISMTISGAIAGLVGLPLLLGQSHKFTSDFPAGIGFIGIAIALLGRNHPVGIALGALLWSFLDRSAQILDLEGIPKEIVTIMQGVSVLAVVVAYEVVNRIRRRAEQSRVGHELATDEPALALNGGKP
jgi:general nucleoside transport system permease protein